MILDTIQLDELRTEMRSLWTKSDAVWDAKQNESDYERFVSADYDLVLKSLSELRSQADSFLELGSGLGVITIMASRLGYDAYGIEAKAGLVERSIEFADEYNSSPQFGVGNFFPHDYQWNAETHGDAGYYDDQAAPAYEELEMDMSEFDLIYVYPWPDEHPLYLDLVRQCARPEAFFLRYDAREGILLGRVAELKA